jgi:rod shape-determining protein MreD
MSGFQAHRPLDSWRWLAIPVVVCVLATLLAAIPFRFLHMRLPEPVFPLILAFAWAVIRPSILPPVLLLLLGLWMDLFWGGPLGLWSIGLLVAYGFVLFTRAMMTGQSRMMMWAWYAATCGLGMLSAYLLTMLDALVTPNLFATFWQFLVTALLYPFAHRLIQRFEDADVRFR